MTYQAGKYHAIIVGAGFGELPNDKATPYLQVDFEPQDLLNPTTGVWEPAGQDPPVIRNVKLWFSDKAAEGSLRRLRQWGWQGTDLRELENGVLDGTDIEVVNRGRDERGYEQWDLPFGESKPVVSDKKVTDALRSKFNRLLRVDAAKVAAAQAPAESAGQAAEAAVKPRSVKRPPRAKADAPPDDEVPF